MPMVQLNTRIDQTLKQQGDAVFARHNVSTSDAVRSLWSYAARTQSLPTELFPAPSHEADAQVHLVAQGAGMVQRELASMGIATSSQLDCKALEEEMYEDMLEAMDGHLAAS